MCAWDIAHHYSRDCRGRRIADLSGSCLQYVLLWRVQQFRQSSLITRYTNRFVFSVRRTSPGILWGHIKVHVPPKTDYMKPATTNDHDDPRIPDVSRGCLRHLQLRCVQSFRRLTIIARYAHGFVLPIYLGSLQGAHQAKRASENMIRTWKHDTTRYRDGRWMLRLSWCCL